MLDRIIDFSLKNRLLIFCVAAGLLVGGALSLHWMEVDVFPDLNAPTVVVMTEARGMAAQEVERLVTFPIETAVNGATNVRRVRSSSTTGFSVVWVEFTWDADIYKARQTVSEKLAVISESLPKTVSKPILGPQSSIMGEILFVSLTSDSLSLMELRDLADWTVRPRLLATGGVAQVTVMGGDIKEYCIRLHTEKMSHYGVTLGDVLEATRRMTDNASGGVFYQYGNEYLVRGLSSTSDLRELQRTPVILKGSQPILLNDIAELEIGSKTPKLGVAAVDGKPAVLMTITKQPNTGTLELTTQLDKALTEIQNRLPAGVELRSDLYRQQEFIDNSISNIQRALIEGAVFVVLVLLVFLMNARTTFISLLSIPLSLVITILTLRFLNMSINTMSIGGMAIAIGSLVDDAIVDVENVYKRLRQNAALPKEQRKNRLQVVFDASREVRIPILNSTLIIVLSFLPLFFLSGMEGRMLKPLGLAFIIALFASTLVALTLTPVLCSFLLQGRGLREQSGEPAWIQAMQRGYDKMLQGALKHRTAVIASAGGVLLITVLGMFALGHSFMPPFNEGSLTINVTTFPGVSLEESDRIGRMADKMILQLRGVRSVARKTGRAELDEHAMGVNASEMEVKIASPKDSDYVPPAILKEEIRQCLQVIPGVNVELGQPISHRLDAMLSGTRANIAIKVFGPDLNRLYMLGQQIREVCQDIPGVVDLNVEQQVERPQLSIQPRREMLGRYGITLPEFNEQINVLLGSEVVAQVFEENRAYNLTVKTDDVSERSMESIRQLRIDTEHHGKIPLEYVADIHSVSGPNTINREDVSRKLVVSANASGRDVGSVVEDMQTQIAQRIALPDGYHITFGGQFESEQAAARILLGLSLLSVFAIFLLLYRQFQHGVQAVIILINLPLALMGGVAALWMTGGVLSIPAIIGFISLFGIATRNGMLLVERYNGLQEAGMSLLQAVRQGSMDRLNPILMTALTSALALIPLAMGGDLPGNEIQSPMAQVILGGLLSSTLLNAVVIPVVYVLSQTRRKKNA